MSIHASILVQLHEHTCKYSGTTNDRNERYKGDKGVDHSSQV